MSEPLSAELRAFLTLHLVPGLGPRLTAALLKHFGSAAAVLRADAAQLRQVPHIGPKVSEQLRQGIRQADVEAEIARMEEFNVGLLALGTPAYPAPLAEVPDPPHLLYCRGNWQARDAKAIGIVGSRHCTASGRRVAERMAADLVRAGFTVISGLARGIDGAAHRGALQAGGRTVAVLAGGLSKIYPPEHTDLAGEVQASGALITEATMAQQPLPDMFPARNRLISGLSRAVVVVEAAERSGALITARHAGEQGREVFAVPGPVDSQASAGTLQLIRQGARLVRGAEDILEDLEGIAVPESQAVVEPPPELDEQQRRIWEFLADGPRHIDDLTRGLGLGVPEASRLLMTLEMKKVVRRLPGSQYERR